MNSIRTVVVLFVLGIGELFAQSVITNVHGIIGFPMGDFGIALDQVGFGPEVGVRIGLADTPFWFGLDFGMLSLEQKKTYLTTPGSSNSMKQLKGEIIAHLATRIQIERDNMIPYVEGLFGIQHFYSESTDDTDPIYMPETNSSGFSTNEVKRVLSGGLAAGILIHAYEYKKESDNKIKNIYLDARVRSLCGGKIDIAGGSDSSNHLYRNVNSNVLFCQFGLVFEF